eukprot:scaffold306886_cov30-Tisochrysis_lutea.AAC.2
MADDQPHRQIAHGTEPNLCACVEDLAVLAERTTRAAPPCPVHPSSSTYERQLCESAHTGCGEDRDHDSEGHGCCERTTSKSERRDLGT